MLENERFEFQFGGINVEEDENDDDMVDDRCFSETTSVNNGERK